jgi:hypothetical protein
MVWCGISDTKFESKINYGLVINRPTHDSHQHTNTIINTPTPQHTNPTHEPNTRTHQQTNRPTHQHTNTHINATVIRPPSTYQLTVITMTAINTSTQSSTHQLTHQHINTGISTSTQSSTYTNTPTLQHATVIFTSHINTPAHQHTSTQQSSLRHINTSSA